MYQEIAEYVTTMTLIIVNVSKHDLDSYLCISSNLLGKDMGTARIYGNVSVFFSTCTNILLNFALLEQFHITGKCGG